MKKLGIVLILISLATCAFTQSGTGFLIGQDADPVSFSSDRIVFNPEGKINGGTGSIYLQSGAGDASALSYNMASRLKIYRWNKTSQTWN